MIHIVVALPAEARPLIDRYRLRRLHAVGPFPAKLPRRRPPPICTASLAIAMVAG